MTKLLKILGLCLLSSLAFAQRPSVNDAMLWDGQRGRYGPILTTFVGEGTNLYFTNARARSSLSVTSPLSYNSTSGLLGLPLTVHSPLVWDSTAGLINLNGLNGLGSAYALIGMNSAGTALQYWRLTVGANMTLTQGADSVLLSSSGGGGTGTTWTLKGSGGSPTISNAKIVTVDQTNGLLVTTPGDTTATISLPNTATTTLGSLTLTDLNMSGLNNSLLYQVSNAVEGMAFGGNRTFFSGNGSTVAPSFKTIYGSYGLDTTWLASDQALRFTTDTTKLATVNSVNLKAAKTVTLTAGTGLTGGGDLSANRSFAISNSGVTATTYGNATTVPQVTFNAQGQATSASNVGIAITQSNITDASATPAASKIPVAMSSGKLNMGWINQDSTVRYQEFYLRSGVDSQFVAISSMTSSGVAIAAFNTDKQFFGSLSAVPLTNGVNIFPSDGQVYDSLKAVVLILKK